MNFKSQTMRSILESMTAVANRFDEASSTDRRDLINPDSPVIVQCGDFGYEVQSIGGDPDAEGFVIMLKPSPVGQWTDGQFKLLS